MIQPPSLFKSPIDRGISLTPKKLLLASLLASMTLSFFAPPVLAIEQFFNEFKLADDRLTKEDMELLQEVYQQIKQNYIDEVDKKVLMEGALKGMVEAVEDPYSEFLNQTEAAPFDDSLEGSFTGIGVQFMIKDGLPTVIAAIDGTPAADAGIKANDIFLSVNDVELQGLSTSEIVSQIRGPLDSELKLTVQRGKKVFDVTLKRAEIPLHTVEESLDPKQKNIGVVKVSQFASTTYDELVTAIKKLRKQGADRFIFDFRYNPGGLLPSALQISNMFLEDGQVIMQTAERQTDPQEFLASDSEFGEFQVNEPFVLLVDEGSASASEILAAAIKENTQSPLIGMTTFGKGTVQQMITDSEYGQLKLTIAKWLTPNGTWIHEKGIEPDQVVEMPEVASAISLNLDQSLTQDDANEFVHSASLMLEALSYLDQPSQFFSEEMVQAVKAFQQDHELTVHGEIDQDTAYQLMNSVRTYLKEHDPQYEKAVSVVGDL